VERVTHALFEILQASGYVKPRAAAATEENLRRMIRRMELNANDTDMWLGMLRQIAWKLDSIRKGDK
jgi:tRNA C32,U32 (ribose-2'-O)-methylase TrmJ